jgi:hypothetical protein
MLLSKASAVVTRAFRGRRPRIRYEIVGALPRT